MLCPLVSISRDDLYFFCHSLQKLVAVYHVMSYLYIQNPIDNTEFNNVTKIVSSQVTTTTCRGERVVVTVPFYKSSNSSW